MNSHEPLLNNHPRLKRIKTAENSDALCKVFTFISASALIFIYLRFLIVDIDC